MATSSPSWKRLLAQRLPLLGHRNWIGIVDAAYPLQTATGIETVATQASHLAVVKEVLKALERASHVRPRIVMDAEMEYLSETLAPGISPLRTTLAKFLKGHPVAAVPHEEIIGKLDAASRLFHVLLFKTTLTLPYTSIFLELDCGYWSDESEKALRKSLSR